MKPDQELTPHQRSLKQWVQVMRNQDLVNRMMERREGSDPETSRRIFAVIYQQAAVMGWLDRGDDEHDEEAEARVARVLSAR